MDMYILRLLFVFLTKGFILRLLFELRHASLVYIGFISIFKIKVLQINEYNFMQSRYL